MAAFLPNVPEKNSKEDMYMIFRQPIRNIASPKETKPRVFDALIDGDDVYLEVKNAKEREIIRLCDVLSQVEDAKRRAAHPKS